MKEYCIYCIWNGGTPFILHTFKNIDSAKAKLFEMISLEEERERPYFVDNDFCIEEKKMTERNEYTEEKKNIENINKIIYLNNFKKVVDK